MTMWEPFTEEARRSIVLGQEQAERENAKTIEAKHLLYGVLCEDTEARRVLASIGADASKVLAAFTSDRRDDTPSREFMFSPRAKFVIESAFSEARALGDSYIGTEHLLLGITRDEDGEAAALLREQNATYKRLRDIVHASKTPPAVESQAEVVAEFTVRLYADGSGTLTSKPRTAGAEWALRAIDVIATQWQLSN